MAYIPKQKGEFFPYQQYYVQPRSPADVHAFYVDPTEFNKVPETFESAKKLISEFARMEIHHFENLAIHSLGRNATLQEYWHGNNDKTWATFYVQEIANADSLKKNMLVVFESKPGKYFRAYVDRLDCKDNILTVTIVDDDTFMAIKNKPLHVYLMVNYPFYVNKLQALDIIAASNDAIKKLAYETPMINQNAAAFDNVFGRMQLPAALNFPVLSNEQEYAVKQMRRHSSSTFVLTGPTGTGKTVTLLKTVMQLVQSGGRILVTTTSNSAADAFTKGLIDNGFEKNLMLRLIKNSYELTGQSEEVKAVTAYDVPINIHQISVVIATVGLGFKLQLVDGLTFSHIIVEDAHEVPEVDIWTCLSMFGLSKETRLILAGDPHLPAPHSIVSNIYSSNTFFKRSMLKRLSNNTAFQQHPALMARLSENHRSHPAIVNALQTLSYRYLMTSTRQGDFCKRLPEGFNYPITFCNVKMAEEGDCNPYETQAIVKYVELLTKTVPPNEIGIIAAGLHQQTLHERMLGNNNGIKLGTAYLFYGFERRIILFAARCCGDNPNYLTEPGYLNLVLSRANDMIVIVGNADYLEKLDDWKTLINICKLNNAYKDESVRLTPAPPSLPPPKAEPYLPPAKRQQRTPSIVSQRRYQTEPSNSSVVSAQVLKTMEAMGQQFQEMSLTVHQMSQKFQVVTSSVAALAQEQSKMVQPKDFEHRRSLMIFGLPESRSKNPSTRIEDDRKKMAKLFDAMNIEVTPVSIYRIPSVPPSDPRAPARRLTAVFANDRDRYIVFGNMHKLRGHPEFGRIIIDPARTKEELQHFKQCKHIVRQVRENGNDDMVFYCNRLCKRTETTPVQLCREEFLELCEKYPLPELVEVGPVGSKPDDA